MRLNSFVQSVKPNIRGLIAKDYSQFLISSDGAGWVLDEEGKEIIKVARSLGVESFFLPRPLPQLKQCVHYTSHFSLADTKVFNTKHRISVDYFHGKPEQGAEFARVFENIKKYKKQISKVRVSYSQMESLVLTTGIDKNKVIRIPIGINPDYFQFQTPELKTVARQSLGIPANAIVVGSFQKDGSGWGDGLEPKHVKGPDVLVKSLGILKKDIPELFVLLTGPARGYVKKGLTDLGIPFKHDLLKSYSEIGRYFQALDAYMISSREEGGPKAVLESMISGVPLVSTRCGQAIDLVQDGHNGFLVEIEDTEALAKKTLQALALRGQERTSILQSGLLTARANSYMGQRDLWAQFFKGYVEA